MAMEDKYSTRFIIAQELVRKLHKLEIVELNQLAQTLFFDIADAVLKALTASGRVLTGDSSGPGR
mgnify:CR=1 FL=1